MGQLQSNQQEYDSCFASCARQDKVSKPARNQFKSNTAKSYQPKDHLQAKRFYQSKEGIKFMQAIENKKTDTSLQNNLPEEDLNCNAKDKDRTVRTCDSGNRFSVETNSKDSLFQEGILGLQSKMSINRKAGEFNSQNQRKGAVYGKNELKKVSSQPQLKESVTTTKEGGSQNNKKHKLQLIHRIQRIKEKFFERQLQLEIYKEEISYERRVNPKKTDNAVQITMVNRQQKQFSKILFDESSSLHQIKEIEEEDSHINRHQQVNHRARKTKNTKQSHVKNGKILAF